MRKNLLVAVLMTALLITLVFCANADEISVEAYFVQSAPRAGELVELEWSVSGISGDFDVEVRWDVISSCLMKTAKTEHFSTASGRAGFTPDVCVDQMDVYVTVTADGETVASKYCYTELAGWNHDGAASFDVINDVDYEAVNQPITARWEINSGRHTISNVRYKWVALRKINDGGDHMGFAD